jgi:uncharacterized protein (TIGR03067 family)
MHWFRMASGLVAGVFAVANALSVRGGNLDPTAVQQEKTEKTEKTAKLEGRWIVLSGTVDGDEQDMKGDKVYIAKGKFTMEQHGGEVQKATYKVHASKKASHIDFTATEGIQKGEVFKGIFILNDDRLTLCLARPGSDRPTEAASKEGSGHILIILEPAKSER